MHQWVGLLLGCPGKNRVKIWNLNNHSKQKIMNTIEDDDLTITPELQAKIDKARKEYKEGKTTTVRTLEELDAFLESL